MRAYRKATWKNRAPNAKPRLMMLINTLQTGGAEVQVVRVAEQLQQRGWDPKVVSLLPLRDLSLELHRAGIDVTSLDMSRRRPSPFALLRLASLIRNYQVDVLNAHLPQASLVARAVRCLTPIPVVISSLHSHKLRSVKSGSAPFEWREFAHRCTDSLADTTTTISRASAERFVAEKIVSSRKLRVVPNGIDTHRFQYSEQSRRNKRAEFGILPGEFVWLSAGRHESVKDLPNMLRAFAKVANRSLLLVCGTGSLTANLQDLCSALRIADRVRFLGARNDIRELMSACDSFVLSSISEGMPMVLLEAAATSLPIVATNVGGNSEVVLHEKTGFLVPPSSPEQLANSMKRMMALSICERLALGSAARSHVVQNFDLARVTGIWENLYYELLTSDAPRAAMEMESFV